MINYFNILYIMNQFQLVDYTEMLLYHGAILCSKFNELKNII